MLKSVKYSIAIIMCVHDADNVEHFKESVESILKQSGVDFFLYILVNGSVGNAFKGYIEELSYIENCLIISSPVNLGLSGAMNFLIDNFVIDTDVKYIARMDSDDISLPNRLKMQYFFMEENSDIDVLGTSCIEIDELGRCITIKDMPVDDDTLKRNIIKKCPFVHPSVMFRRKVFDDGFRYNSKLMNTQDYYLWVDLASCGYKFHNLNEPLLKFRRTTNFFKKRGRGKALNDLKSRFYAMKKLKAYSVNNLFFSFSLFLLRLSPSYFSRIAYKYLR